MSPKGSRVSNIQVPTSYLIEFQNITMTLKNGTTIMHNVSGQFKPGRLCAIMGPSGESVSLYVSLSVCMSAKVYVYLFI